MKFTAKKNVSFCKLPRREKVLEVLCLNSHLILSEYIVSSRAAAVASKIYILFYLFFFCNGLFFEGKKNPSKFGGIFVKENKCYFLKVKPPISWGGIFVKENKCYFLKFFKGKTPNKLGGFLKNKSSGVFPLSWGEKKHCASLSKTVLRAARFACQIFFVYSVYLVSLAKIVL
jgi:hypothetical protein